MNRSVKICLIISIMLGFSINANAFQWVAELVTNELYVYDINPIPETDVADFLSVNLSDLLIAKVEDNDDPPGEGIGTVLNPFGLTVDYSTPLGEDNEAEFGTWSTELPIYAFQLKAGDYSLLALVDPSATTGTWDLRPLFDWLDNGKTPALSHFTAYTISPVPEPATMMLFGIGLLGLAGVSRRKK